MTGTDVDVALDAASQLHQQGRLAEAEALYRSVLKQRPGDFDVLQALANLALQSGRMEAAVEHLQAALAVRPEAVATRCNLGKALRLLGRLPEALAQYEAAIGLKSGDAALGAVLWTDRATLLHKLQKPGALESLDHALALNPDFADAWYRRANICYGLSRFDEAFADYGRAIALSPKFADAFINRGIVSHKLGLFDDAIADFDRAIALRSNDPAAYLNKATTLLHLKRPNEAVDCLKPILSDHPNLAEGWRSQGLALVQMGRFQDAVDSYDRSIALAGRQPETHLNKGAALLRLGRHEEALLSFNHAIELNPEQADAYLNKGAALLQLGLTDEALTSLDHAIVLKPGYPDAYFNRSMVFLTLGDFERGWLEFENRKKKANPIGWRNYSQPYLEDARDQRGKVVLIHTDQGFGDTIQFCRYLPMLQDLGAKVMFAPEAALRALMSTLSPPVEIVDGDAGLAFDCHSPLMSLPFSFSTRLDTIPAKVPYLKAEPARTARWRERIGAEGFRIGVCWRGTNRIPGRAFPLASLNAIASLPGVRLISLQKGEGEADFAAHPDLKIERLEGLDEGSQAFVDTASEMQSLDLVITCDTAIAHLAGALARPTWVALPHVADWRWLLDRADSPWYPTLRLFRQKARGDWGSVFAAMQAALRVRLGAVMNGSPP